MPKLETKFPPPHCPRCNMKMDGYRHAVGDRSPEPGDWALCAECRCLSRYTETMQLRPVTPEELEGALERGEVSHEEIVMSGMIIDEVHKRRPKH